MAPKLSGGLLARRGSDATSISSSVSPNLARKGVAAASGGHAAGKAPSRAGSFFFNAVTSKHVARSSQDGGRSPSGGRSTAATPVQRSIRSATPISMMQSGRASQQQQQQQQQSGGSSSSAASGESTARRWQSSLQGYGSAALALLPLTLIVQLFVLLRSAVYAAVDAIVSHFLEDSSLALYYETEPRSRRPSVNDADPGDVVADIAAAQLALAKGVDTTGASTGARAGAGARASAGAVAPRTPRKMEQAAARESRRGDSPVNAISAVRRLMARREREPREQRDSNHSIHSEPALRPRALGKVAASRPLRKTVTLEPPAPHSPPPPRYVPALRQAPQDGFGSFDPRLV